MALVNSTISALADDLLDSLVTRLAAAGVVVPDRRYRTAGEVALDCCPQLVVTALGLNHSFPGGEAGLLVCSPPRHVALEVWLTRCVPTLTDNGAPPSAEALDASGEEIQTDMFVLPYVLWEGFREGDWGSTCASVLLGPVVAYGPAGECGGVHAAVNVLLT